MGKTRGERRIERAKRLHRPSFKLHDWYREALCRWFAEYREGLEDYGSFSTTATCNTSSELPHAVCQLEYNEISGIEKLSGPCVIRDIPKYEKWNAVTSWPKLLSSGENSKYQNRKLKCGEDDDGCKVKIRLNYFLSYMKKNFDDSPLYIFDSNFDTDKVNKSLLDDYAVPSLFRDDLFGLISERRRPPYRWFLIGPERSGTTIHTDPLGTAAWNTLIAGKKRWVLFPPSTPKRWAKASQFCKKGEDDEASQYFMQMLPRLKRDAKKYPERYQGLEIYEFTQNEGETVFIPHGWWHAVLNLTHTIGVTQNFVSERVCNFDAAWVKTRTGRKKMAWKWLEQLKQHHPHLAKRALELNRRDNFVMKYDPKNPEQQARERKKAGKGRLANDKNSDDKSKMKRVCRDSTEADSP
mmetsp:Transcript_13504/g.20557  ORF Transcript_13504/g.20557 Transcript_13504/m.20557 type:complete len:410 (+) Transcript_13504:35-1264(+)